MSAATPRGDGVLHSLYWLSPPPPTGWDWAAKALDCEAPDSFKRGASGGEPIATPTIEQAKARNIVFPTPGDNKEALKAIRDRAMQDEDPAV